MERLKLREPLTRLTGDDIFCFLTSNTDQGVFTANGHNFVRAVNVRISDTYAHSVKLQNFYRAYS